MRVLEMFQLHNAPTSVQSIYLSKLQVLLSNLKPPPLISSMLTCFRQPTRTVSWLLLGLIDTPTFTGMVKPPVLLWEEESLLAHLPSQVGHTSSSTLGGRVLIVSLLLTNKNQEWLSNGLEMDHSTLERPKNVTTASGCAGGYAKHFVPSGYAGGYAQIFVPIIPNPNVCSLLRMVEHEKNIAWRHLGLIIEQNLMHMQRW